MRFSLFGVLAWGILSFGGIGLHSVAAAPKQEGLGRSLEDVYTYWREAMVTRNYERWHQSTATHRRKLLENRIHSEKGSWPADIFDLPTDPPGIRGLRLLRARSKGMTAKSVYIGRVDFGAGGGQADNLLVLSFLYEGRGWKFDTAEFINLDNIKDVRAQIAAGNLSYVDSEDFLPTGKKPEIPITVARPKYIGKVYTYCPGREVKVRVNKISKHRFQDNQQSEVIIGGVRDGLNDLVYEIKDLPGYRGSDPLTLRIYVMSQIQGVKPVKVYQYQTAQGEQPKASGSATFRVDPEIGARILGLR
ncbi:MAG: hypothetical protein ACPH5P_00780 [Akkermansiaceae bacterium]